jgi:class 3 adenylate cyclase
MSGPTFEALHEQPQVEALGEQQVKGREGSILAYRLVAPANAGATIDMGG